MFEGVHFEIQIGGPKSFPFKWKHWFLVSGMSELSKNIFVYNSPQNSSERVFLDITTLTISMERVLAALLFAALLFAGRVNNSSADNPFP